MSRWSTTTNCDQSMSLPNRIALTRPRAAGLRTVMPHRKSSSGRSSTRSEEHTSELQSRSDLVCRLLLEKKKKKRIIVRREKKEQQKVYEQTYTVFHQCVTISNMKCTKG